MIDSPASSELLALRRDPKRLAVLIACFNRREVTLRCLRMLFTQDVDGYDMQVFLVDDASTDGTYEAVRELFPNVRLFRGTGALFWNRSMHLAFGAALGEGFDYYLWLNDDNFLVDGALSSMLATEKELSKRGVPAIVVGNTQNPITLKHTYGGLLRGPRLRPAAYQLAKPTSTTIQPCDTMNGNCTLIPEIIAHKIGNLDKGFSHNFGDIDYGLRAKEAGFAVYMAPGFIGACSENTKAGTWKDRSLDLRQRWLLMRSPKGCPWAEWSHFAKRHLGDMWVLYAASPYIRVISQAVLGRKLS